MFFNQFEFNHISAVNSKSILYHKQENLNYAYKSQNIFLKNERLFIYPRIGSYVKC
jgi:hypothetical protein